MTTDGEAINALREAIIAVQTELGISPSTVYGSVRARLDIIEKRITNPLSPSPNVDNPFIIGNDDITISTGSGEPTEDRLPGSLYLRTDGYVFEGLYSRRTDGYWHLISTDPWTAGGDLDGDYLSQTVIGIQGRSVVNVEPDDGYVLTWNDDGYWEPQISFLAAGDLSGTITNQTVVKIQGRDVDSTTPNDNDIYVWNSSNDIWYPEKLAVVFDPYHNNNSTNLRSNKFTVQSPIDNTKTGIVNFSSDSSLTTSGVTENYGAILSGDKNQVLSSYSIIAGGALNNIDSIVGDGYGVITGGYLNYIGTKYSAVLGGYENKINTASPSGEYSVIVGGRSNTVNGEYSFIGGGYNNSVSGTNVAILSGNTCSVGTSIHGTILTGNNNSIISGSNYSLIASGNNNLIDGICSSILCGDFINIESSHSIVLHGSSVNINANSYGSVILSAENSNIDGYYSLLFGAVNNIVSVNDGYSYVFGKLNDLQGDYSLVFGDENQLAGINSSYSFVFGKENDIGIIDTIDKDYAFVFGKLNSSTASHSTIFGENNSIDGHHSTTIGSNNEVNDGYSIAIGINNIVSGNHSIAIGSENETNNNYNLVFGNQGSSNFDNQLVFSARSLSDGYLGSSQKSEIILDGYGVSGGAFNLTIPGTLNNLLLENDKVYDMTIRILIVTENGSYACARFIYDVLAKVESGGLTLINATTATHSHNSGAPANVWTVTISNVLNALQIQIDSSGVEDRRAITTIEWRELSRN